jgi:hypothetical protein
MARVTTDAGLPYFVQFTMDARVFAFFALVCGGTSVLFGLAPALQVSRPNVDRALRDSSRTTTGGVPARRFSSAIVVAELVLAVVLLTGAGLLIRSFVALYTIDLGMNTAPLLTMRMDLTNPKYPDAPERIAFYQQLEERLPGHRRWLGRGRVLGLDRQPVHREFRRQLAALLPSISERVTRNAARQRGQDRHKHLGAKPGRHQAGRHLPQRCAPGHAAPSVVDRGARDLL